MDGEARDEVVGVSRKEGVMTSIGDDFPKEQERVRELLAGYRSIGPAGLFGATMIERVLRRADAAAMSGDIVAILASYKELRECE